MKLRTDAAGFLHTSEVHVPTFEALMQKLLPGTASLHHVDPSLLADARHLGAEAVAGRVRTALAALRDRGTRVVCCTCSSIAAVAEEEGSRAGIRVLRVDRPMVQEAVAQSESVTVVAALASTVETTRALLVEEAERAGTAPMIDTRIVSGAWERFEAGDLVGYRAAIEQEVRELLAEGTMADAVVLAQASMAPVADALDSPNRRVLAAPRSAILALRLALEDET